MEKRILKSQQSVSTARPIAVLVIIYAFAELLGGMGSHE